MKFQNPSMHGSWQKDEPTHRQPKPICPVNFFEVGGIITDIKLLTCIHIHVHYTFGNGENFTPNKMADD